MTTQPIESIRERERERETERKREREGVKEGEEGNVLFNDTLNTFLFMVIWHRTYDKGPFR